ncbi:4Fe-4S dicluster domain-containing protein [Desulfosporosinus lacus]|uniref:Fe-S-cluster-containing dehydrogenase component n=1 Tax=Desulfosporosinus lacus DSM 15449 TaxID=1121420 RepID=A0A1M5YY22_9FIRM|nr:4Fe-4S dicluster domain-containing protein [Desulfosporosinus lacus]SHI16433.1 Fe-S-cluster-containing dehydrogenase component [Desulfosporosinus lacus DSM 15449]
MKGEKKKVKLIKVDLDKCIACRACELACSAFHAKPKYSSINPARSRIRLVMDVLNDEYVPIRATEYTKSECVGRQIFTINEKEYSECSFCGASCPSRDLFREPDSGLPLKCDMCEDESGHEPKCVKVCTVGALVYEEYEEEVNEEVKEKEKQIALEMGLKSLLDKYGAQRLLDSFVRMSQKG